MRELLRGYEVHGSMEDDEGLLELSTLPVSDFPRSEQCVLRQNVCPEVLFTVAVASTRKANCMLLVSEAVLS